MSMYTYPSSLTAKLLALIAGCVTMHFGASVYVTMPYALAGQRVPRWQRIRMHAFRLMLGVCYLLVILGLA